MSLKKWELVYLSGRKGQYTRDNNGGFPRPVGGPQDIGWYALEDRNGYNILFDASTEAEGFIVHAGSSLVKVADGSR